MVFARIYKFEALCDKTNEVVTDVTALNEQMLELDVGRTVSRIWLLLRCAEIQKRNNCQL